MEKIIIKSFLGIWLTIDTIVRLVFGSYNGRIGNAKLNWHSFINI